jgi:U3 small nucleolar ribonucleoprotein protein IMP3
MRQLKHHEKKLLRKVDLYNYNHKQQKESFDTLRIAKVQRRYHLQNGRTEYIAYNKLIGQMTQLATKLQLLSPTDTFRIAMTEQLLQKCYHMGLLRSDHNSNNTSLHDITTQITVSQFCRRRLSSILVKLKMAPTCSMAVTLIEQGQIRVGPNIIQSPAFLVPRTLEDYVTWVDASKIQRTVQRYNNKLDDFDLL